MSLLLEIEQGTGQPTWKTGLREAATVDDKTGGMYVHVLTAFFSVVLLVLYIRV